MYDKIDNLDNKIDNLDNTIDNLDILHLWIDNNNNIDNLYVIIII